MSSNATPQRRPLMAANWKMYKTVQQTDAFLKEFLPSIAGVNDVDVVICPPYTGLAQTVQAVASSSVAVGAQNMNENEEGAFTGEISGAMLSAVGCRYVILGHSERRQLYGETDASVNKKILAAMKHNLVPIVCVGESLSERDANETLSVVNRQVRAALANISSAETKKLVIAYEPIWAIGTGRTATPAQAQQVHLAIRDILKDQYGSLTSLAIRILYGGSVKPENITELMACEDIDGGLIGGASLKPESFRSIINYRSAASAK